MKVTPYNQYEAIEYLKALAHLYFTTESLSPPHSEDERGMKLWNLAMEITTKDAEDAVRAFEATQ